MGTVLKLGVKSFWLVPNNYLEKPLYSTVIIKGLGREARGSLLGQTFNLRLHCRLKATVKIKCIIQPTTGIVLSSGQHSPDCMGVSVSVYSRSVFIAFQVVSSASTAPPFDYFRLFRMRVVKAGGGSSCRRDPSTTRVYFRFCLLAGGTSFY